VQLPKIILHIGGEKTGTTSIQNYLHTQRDALSKLGVLFPSSPKWNHVLLPLFADPGDATRDLRSILAPEELSKAEDLIARFPERLRAEIISSRCSRVILSNEHCSSRLSASSVAKLVEMLKSISVELQIIYYARPQDELLLSGYSTHVKSGSCKSITMPVGVGSHYYDHSVILDKWNSVIDCKQIAAYPYERDSAAQANVIRHFFNVCDLPEEALTGVELTFRMNRALAGRPLEFLRLLNAHLPPFVDGVPSKYRAEILKALEQLYGGEDRSVRVRNAQELFQRFYQSFRASNDKVAAKYWDGPHDRLFVRTDSIEVIEAEALTADDVMRIWVAISKLGSRPNKGIDKAL